MKLINKKLGIELDITSISPLFIELEKNNSKYKPYIKYDIEKLTISKHYQANKNNEYHSKEMIKDVPGYLYNYQVSSLGIVLLNGKAQPQSKTQKGYRIVYLKDTNNKTKNVRVSRLVMMTFKPCKNMHLLECNHLDGNKDNNNLNNLEWTTTKENVRHAKQIGLYKEPKKIIVNDLVFNSVDIACDYLIGTNKVNGMNKQALTNKIYKLCDNNKNEYGYNWSWYNGNDENENQRLKRIHTPK